MYKRIIFFNTQFEAISFLNMFINYQKFTTFDDNMHGG